ncbi:MAG: hypothetical protein ACTSWU_00885 [Candidatus Thorarchaeota archaeon]
MRMKDNLLVTKCPHCGGHSEGVVTTEGEFYFVCDFCNITQTYYHVPKDNFGKVLLCAYSKKPELKDYVLLTVMFKDGEVEYFVLSNTDVVWKGNSMVEGAKEYTQTVDRVGIFG